LRRWGSIRPVSIIVTRSLLGTLGCSCAARGRCAVTLAECKAAWLAGCTLRCLDLKSPAKWTDSAIHHSSGAICYLVTPYPPNLFYDACSASLSQDRAAPFSPGPAVAILPQVRVLKLQRRHERDAHAVRLAGR